MPSVLEYKSSGWNTHGESRLHEIAQPLFEGCPDHFTVTRFYTGPAETYAAAADNTVDAIFNGVAKSVTGVNAGDIFTFAADHNLVTGDPVVLAITTGLSSLTAGNTYYFIRLTADTGQVATTKILAAAGTAANFGADGTGTLTPPIAYLIDQGPRRDADAGQVDYERTFANVPPSWSEGEETVFEYPAYIAPIAFGTTFSVTAITASGGNFVLSTVATGITSGEGLYVSITYTRGGRDYHTTFRTKAVAASSGVSVTIPGVLPGSGTFSAVDSTNSSVREGTTGRTVAESLVTGSRLLHDYALTSETAWDTDLPLMEKFSPVNSSGNYVNSLSTGTATVPNSSVYSALITAGAEIVAEPSTRRRYRGNIHVRTTRLVKAR